MIFLIEYNRGKGQIVTLRRFRDSQKRKAEEARLEIELNANREGADREVVLLEAESEKALRRTHQRYFADLAQMLKSAAGQDK